MATATEKKIKLYEPTVMQGVTAGTQQQLANYQNPYQQSDAVNQAQQLMNQYSGPYSQSDAVNQAQNLMNQYNGPYSESDAVKNLQEQMNAHNGPYSESDAVLQAQNLMNQYSGEYQASDETNAAKEKLNQYSDGYQASDAVNQAQQLLQQASENRPGQYAGKYDAQLENVLNQILNPGEFKYEFNGDNLFNAYKDMYNQQAKQASMNAAGQAAALTGGYGNSYAQMAANQAYQQNMMGLYDKGMDLYDRAYQRWQGEQNNNLNAYNVLANADASDYARYRDTVGDWERERDYLANRADTERAFDYTQFGADRDFWANRADTAQAFDYSKYLNDRDYYTGRYDAEKAFDYNDYLNDRDYWTNQYNSERNFDYGKYQDQRDYYTSRYDTERNFDYNNYLNNRDYYTSRYDAERNFDYNDYMGNRDYWTNWALNENNDYRNEQARIDANEQFQQNMNWQREQDDRKYAYNYVTSILANGQMPSAELLAAAGISQADAQAMMEQATTGGGRTGSRTPTTPTTPTRPKTDWQSVWDRVKDQIQKTRLAQQKQRLLQSRIIPGTGGVQGLNLNTRMNR